MSLTEKDVQIIYLDLLSRFPNLIEISEGLSYREIDLRSYLQQSTEYQKLNGTYRGKLDYNLPQWSINMSDIPRENHFGVTLTNGKIAFATANNYQSTKSGYITTKYDFDHIGQYANNVQEIFHFTSFTIGSLLTETPTQEVFNLTQTLFMKTAIFNTAYDVSHNDMIVSVSSDIIALRPYPYSSLQTIRLNSHVDQTIDLYHYISAPKSISNVRFSNNVLDLENNANLYVFQANGVLDSQHKNVTTTCCYVHFTNGGSFANKGYNMMLNNPRIGFNRFTIDLKADQDYRLHIISTSMTQFDFPAPELETTRILMQLYQKGPDEIRQDHVKQWNKQWVDHIEIKPKDGITQTQTDQVHKLQRLLTFSLFNIFSAVRDDVYVEMNPLNISTMDLNGHIFWSAELWLIPVLLFLKPSAARNLLNHRFVMLEKAKRLAMAHGYRGSRYPYQQDVLGYNDLYWDNVSPLYVYNTALISINAWNYYRVSRDKDWLIHKGYPMLTSNAQFFESKAEEDPIGSGIYHIRNVIGVNNIQGDNNAMTNYLARMALKYAIEATYEINYRVNSKWITIYEGLKISTFQVPLSPLNAYHADIDVSNANVIKLDDEYGNIGNNVDIKLYETLLLLHPYYSKELPTVLDGFTPSIIPDNIRHVTKHVKPNFANNYFNTLMLSTLWGTQAQQEDCCQSKLVSDVQQLSESLNAFVEANTLPPWDIFFNNNLPKTCTTDCGDTCGCALNDIAISSMFVLMFLTSLGGLRITGGINQARFYYEEFMIKSKSAFVLPESWKSLTISGVGLGEGMFTILNKVYRPGTCD